MTALESSARRELDGLVAIVTGGASGIGSATALRLSELGAEVIAFDLTDEVAEPLTGLIVDISSRTSVEAGMATVDERFGRLDIVVNNAGISAVGTVADNGDDEWTRVLDINVIGMARVSAAALPLLRRSPAAAIVNICSIAATAGLPFRALYSASKGAVYALTLAMAADHVREGVRVNCVNPGTVSTPFVDRMLARFDDPVAERAALNARQATGRMVTPAEVAAMVAFLAGPHSGSTTGASFAVDGGMSGLRIRPE